MNAYSTNSCTVPPMSVNPKDHKVGEENGDPKSRPICDGSQSLNCRLSDIISKVITPLLKEKRGEEGDEVESTEELLSVVDKMNEKLRKEGMEGKGSKRGSRGTKEQVDTQEEDEGEGVDGVEEVVEQTQDSTNIESERILAYRRYYRETKSR